MVDLLIVLRGRFHEGERMVETERRVPGRVTENGISVAPVWGMGLCLCAPHARMEPWLDIGGGVWK